MGREAAIVFTREGAKVCVADLDLALAEETVTMCSGEAFAFGVNVADEDGVRAMYAATAERFGGIDVLYNNAGISPADDDSILVTEPDAWDRVQDVNTKGVYLCCKHGTPYLLERGGGSVSNVASFVAILGAATSQISYSASKGGVLSMSRELGVQFAREGVRVNALCPGPVNTPLLQELFAKDEERAARRLVHVPMGRFGEPEEMANAVLFLASDESSFITASTFLVDGGISGAYVTPL
jgi:NAD(P)-dependent dehydrogenase (short-subunit alcohol dehydrogenase family)